MELQVTLTLSDRLFGLLEDKLPNLGRRVEKALTKEIGAQVRKSSEISIEVKPSPAPLQAEAATDAPAPATDAKHGQPEAKTVTKEKPRDLGVEIREIMHRTRQRFEGEDYKNNADSDLYKKYHRAMTTQFKQIAMALGYEKPPMIDDPAKVDAFAAECDALIIDEDGFIAPPPAPY